MTPKKKARASVKAKVRDIVRRGGSTPMPELVTRINATVRGWVNYY
jgi:RNA-directed DNA polymerase